MGWPWEVPSPLLPNRLHGLRGAGQVGALGHQDPATDTSRLLLLECFYIWGLTVEVGGNDP